MTKPITRVCRDCGVRLKNRSRTTRRCQKCAAILRAACAIGRKTDNCIQCAAKLSVKKTTTGLCFACWKESPKPKRLPTGKPAWNRKMEAEKLQNRNMKRRQRRAVHGHCSREYLSDCLRTLIRNSFRRNGLKKDTKTVRLLGCPIGRFRERLECQFTEGMSWTNYGNSREQWNIDHIEPISAFDLSDPEQQYKAFNFKNCQPMWAIDNRRKGGKH